MVSVKICDLRDEEDRIFRNRGSSKSVDNSSKQKRSLTTVPTKYTRFEEVLERINPFGPYQIFVCICIIFAQIEWGGNFSFVNLVGSIEPDWECVLADDHQQQNDTNKIVVISALTEDQSKCEFIRANCTSFKAIQRPTEFNSIVASFRLICEDGDKPEAIQIAQALSMMLGSIIGGHIGDQFGRQCLFYMCQLGVIVTSCLTTASTSWIGYAAFQSVNGFLYGILEVESLAMVMEYTNNQYRMIPVACFVQHCANMVVALIAHFSRDWQMFFVFLNLITSPIILAFMLFHESPRWLVARGKFNEASIVLNDMAATRWNGTGAEFSAEQLSALPHERRSRAPVSFFHLFSRPRFAKQSLVQMLSMFTYSMIGMCYFYVIRDFPFSSINILFLDGLLRLCIPVLVILADMHFKQFTRRFQFLCSLSLMGLCFGACSLLVGLFRMEPLHWVVVILVIITGMLNDSLFWMNIVQVTTQRYPTVIRCIAFGCLHSFRHIGTIAGILIMQPLMQSAPVFNFIIPFALICLTLVIGLFLQPDTKGKALLDTLDELDYARLETALPQVLYRMAVIHRAMGSELHAKVEEMKIAEA